MLLRMGARRPAPRHRRGTRPTSASALARQPRAASRPERPSSRTSVVMLAFHRDDSLVGDDVADNDAAPTANPWRGLDVEARRLMRSTSLKSAQCPRPQGSRMTPRASRATSWTAIWAQGCRCATISPTRWMPSASFDQKNPTPCTPSATWTVIDRLFGHQGHHGHQPTSRSRGCFAWELRPARTSRGSNPSADARDQKANEKWAPRPLFAL